MRAVALVASGIAGGFACGTDAATGQPWPCDDMPPGQEGSGWRIEFDDDTTVTVSAARHAMTNHQCDEADGVPGDGTYLSWSARVGDEEYSVFLGTFWPTEEFGGYDIDVALPNFEISVSRHRCSQTAERRHACRGTYQCCLVDETPLCPPGTSVEIVDFRRSGSHGSVVDFHLRLAPMRISEVALEYPWGRVGEGSITISGEVFGKDVGYRSGTLACETN